MAESATHVRVIEETSAYWRILFDYPSRLQDVTGRQSVFEQQRVRRIWFADADVRIPPPRLSVLANSDSKCRGSNPPAPASQSVSNAY
jgi:hypothetical protein